MGVCHSAARLAICHRNIKQMISRFTGILSNTNIANMSNSSRGEFAYTLLDVEDAVSDEQLKALRETDGVLKVRLIGPAAAEI